MEVPKFPLPLGHVFGPSRLHVTHHDGSSRVEGAKLRLWQNRYCSAWRRPWMHPSGLFDGLTQRAVVEVQQVCGYPRTGLLGAREWAAVWNRQPLKPPEPEPEPEPRKPATRKKRSNREKKKRRKYWSDYSRWNVEPGSDPDAPKWFPGRPFGPHAKGDYVTEVQHLLGFAETGRFSLEMSKRVAGLQRVNGLPESGLVDARTARVIEGLRK